MFGIRIENERMVFDKKLEVPEIAPHEVLIQVAYAGVNRADLFQMQGSYPPPKGASPLPGLEASGRIAKVGVDVKGWQVGDEVCALLEGGGYAQFAKAPATQVLAVPKGWSLQAAGGIVEALYTVWLSLFQTANVQAGEQVLIHGGASGIGSIAVQMVKAAGATAITTAGSDAKCRFSESLGAARSYDYNSEDWVEALKADFGRVDVLLDIVGGDYFQKNLSVMKPYGLIVSIAFLRGAKAEVNMASLLLKQLSWHGLTLRSRTREQKAILTAEIRENCIEWLMNKRVTVPIDEVFALKDASLAIEKMEQNLNFGKILLKA